MIAAVAAVAAVVHAAAAVAVMGSIVPVGEVCSQVLTVAALLQEAPKAVTVVAVVATAILELQAQ